MNYKLILSIAALVGAVAAAGTGPHGAPMCDGCEITGTGGDQSLWGWENEVACEIDTSKCGGGNNNQQQQPQQQQPQQPEQQQPQNDYNNNQQPQQQPPQQQPEQQPQPQNDYNNNQQPQQQQPQQQPQTDNNNTGTKTLPNLTTDNNTANTGNTANTADTKTLPVVTADNTANTANTADTKTLPVVTADNTANTANTADTKTLPNTTADTANTVNTANTANTANTGNTYTAKPIGNEGKRPGKTTRYWDCCKPSCSWSGKATVSHPVNTCSRDGSLISDVDARSGCDGGEAFMCTDQQPWAVSDTLSYGFAAASISGGSESTWCCACYKLTFTSTSIAGKEMIVQVTNTGGDLGENHFDLQMPGGGLGIFDGCSGQFNTNAASWGERYGGLQSVDGCANLPASLQDGCKWRFDWFENADNPEMEFEEVECPAELVKITGCSRS